MKWDDWPYKETGFFKLARSVSFHSTHNRVHIGCVIVKNGKPVSVGFNQSKTHPMYKRINAPNVPFIQGIHAEMAAIASARTDLTGTVAYVYREDRKGEIADSKPCPACQRLLEMAGVEKVYFTKREYPYFDFLKIQD